MQLAKNKLHVISAILGGLREENRSFLDAAIQGSLDKDALKTMHDRKFGLWYSANSVKLNERGFAGACDLEFVSLHSSSDFFLLKKQNRCADYGAGRTTASRVYQNVSLENFKTQPSVTIATTNKSGSRRCSTKPRWILHTKRMPTIQSV